MIGIFLVASASASDLNETTFSEIDEEVVSIEDSPDEMNGAANEDFGILSVNHTPHNFNEIKTSVESASDGDTIILDGYYLFESTVTVNKTLNFVGKNNATVDGNKSVGLFSIYGNGITFKYITFKNGNAIEGGAIDGSYGSFSVVNCSLVNNFAKDCGGAINGGTAVNCTFIANQAGRYIFSSDGDGDGGAMYNSNAINCIFINNTASGYDGWGGAMCGGSAVSCTFVGNHARKDGGAFYFRNVGSVVNCSFINNSAGRDGGAIYLPSYYSISSAVNCSFVNNYAKDCGGALRGFSAVCCNFTGNNASEGGAIYEGNAENCIFDANHADCGGAIYAGNEGYYSISSVFVNNSANIGGAVYNVSVKICEFTSNNASENGGAMYGGSAVDSTFLSNHADGYGGAVCNANVSTNSQFKYNTANIGDDTYNVTFFDDDIGRTFYDLNVLVNGNNNSEVYLTGNYTFIETLDFEFREGIKINRAVIIYGNGFTLNGAEAARIFNVNNESVVFHDIVFVNGETNGVGGAIKGKCCAVNCTFINNSAADGGGALYCCDAFNSTFMGNYAKDSSGGAMSGGSAVNCTFINNKAGFGGVIYMWNDSYVVNCSFINNSADHSGGAIYTNYGYSSAVNCSFSNNTADFGGAMSGGSAVNCTFEGHGSNVLIRTSNILDCIFDVYPTVDYHYTSLIHANNLSIFLFEDGFLYVNLSSMLGALSNKNITININGENHDFTTNSNGTVTLNIKDYLSKIGKHVVTISYSGDEINNPVSLNASIIIKYYSSLSVNDLSTASGEDAFLIVNLSSIEGAIADRIIFFIIEGVKYNATTDSNGLALFNIKNLISIMGECDIPINFSGDEVFTPNSTFAHVIIKYKSYFQVNNLSIVQGDDGILNVHLLNNVGPMFDKQVKLVYNGGNDTKTTDFDGLAYFNIKNYISALGEYTLNFSYDGDEFNTPASTNVTIKINRYKGNLTITQDGKYYGDTILFAKLVNSKSGLIIPYAPIDLAFSNGKTVSVTTDENGECIYNVPFSPGNYKLTAKVMTDYTDVNTVVINDLAINEIIGTIEINKSSNNRTLTVRVYNPNNGDVYRNIRVNLDFSNGESDSVKTNKEGIATYKISFTLGTYSVLASASGKYMQISSAQLKNIVISTTDSDDGRIYSKITFGNDIVFDYQKSGSTTIAIVGGGIGSMSIVGNTNAKPVLKGNVITVSGLNVGSYILRVVTAPDDDFISVVGTVSVTVNRVNAAITAKVISVQLKKSNYFNVKLKDKSGKPISNVIVTLKIYTGKKVKTVNIKTNSKGEINYNTKGLSKGTHKVLISVFDNGYFCKQASSSIKVIKPKALKFKLHKKVNSKKGSLITYQILNKKTKKPVNGVKVKLKIFTGKKFKSFALKTKKVGKYKGIVGLFSNEFSVGKHKVVIEPTSIKYSGSGKTTIKIKKSAKKYPAKTTKA